MAKSSVCIGMVGAGRASQLHMDAYRQVSDIHIRYKNISARREEQLIPFASHYGFEKYTFNFEELLHDPEIDVIDICTPPYIHEHMIRMALRARKHVICEKPLSAYCGKPGDSVPIGFNVSKRHMYETLLHDLATLKAEVRTSGKLFMYAENFVYAPTVLKAAEIIAAKKSRILVLKGEESLKGSSSPVAGEWDKTGGGTFIRTGTHPLSAILWLKQVEAKARETEIGVASVMGDTAIITANLDKYEHRHIAARPHDVEDFGCAIITFTDGTKGVVMASDTLLGGSRNYVEAYCNDAAIICNLTLTNNMSTYFLDEHGLDDVYISEMLPSKLGWNNPFIADEVMRGYVNEMQDFMEAVAFERAPKADFDLAYQTMKVLYAAYVSAEEGKTLHF